MMKLIITTILLLSCFGLLAQEQMCEKIYENPEIIASCQNTPKGQTDFILKRLVPIIAPLSSSDEPIISSLHMILTINRNREVIAAKLEHFPGSSDCRDKVVKELLNMKCWIPGQVAGKSVCSIYHWHITCFKWDFE